MAGQLLKERICSHRSKFFPFRVDLVSDGLCQVGKQIHFWPQPTNSDSDELYRVKLFVYIDG